MEQGPYRASQLDEGSWSVLGGGVSQDSQEDGVLDWMTAKGLLVGKHMRITLVWMRGNKIA